jgi:hypothetical protein
MVQQIEKIRGQYEVDWTNSGPFLVKRFNSSCGMLASKGKANTGYGNFGIGIGLRFESLHVRLVHFLILVHLVSLNIIVIYKQAKGSTMVVPTQTGRKLWM